MLAGLLQGKCRATQVLVNLYVCIYVYIQVCYHKIVLFTISNVIYFTTSTSLNVSYIVLKLVTVQNSDSIQKLQ